MGMQSLGKHKIAVDTASLGNGDSIASYLVDAAGNLLTSTLLSGKQRLDVMNPSDFAEDSIHNSGDYGQFVLAVRDDGVQASAILGPNTFTAVNFGTSGNSISLVFNGTNSVSTVVTAWNAANPSNQVTFTGSGATVPTAQTVNLSNGAFNTVMTSAPGDYSPFAVDKYGRLLTSTELDVDFDYVFAEDTAHTSGDLGGFSLAVRRDARSSGASASGDYASFNVNSVGELWVKDEDVYGQLVLANASLDAIEADADEMNISINNIEADIDEMNISLNNVEASALSIDTSLNNIEGFFKAEDSIHVSSDMGMQSLAVRKDAYGSSVSADGDYASMLQWGNGELKVVNIANGSILQQRITVAATATALPTSALSFRKSLMIQNGGTTSIWVGSGTVTSSGTTEGIEVPKNSFMELEVGPAVSVFGITSTGTNNVKVLEMA